MEESPEIEKRKSKINKILFSWVKDNYDRVFIAVLLLAFVLRLAIFLKTLNQPLWYDGATYMEAGKNWALDLGLRDIWYYRRGFFFALLCAFFFKLGLGETAIRFSIVLFSTGIVFVSYFLLNEMFGNKKISLLTTLCLTFSWIILFFTGRILTDIPAAFFLLTALFFFWKGYINDKGKKFIFLFAIFLSLATLTRMQSIMFFPPFLIIIFLKEKFAMFKNKKLWIVLLIFLAFLLPYFYLYSQHYGNPIKDLFEYYVGVGSSDVAKDVASERSIFKFPMYFKDLPYMLTYPFFALLILGLFYFFLDVIFGFDRIFQNKKIQTKLFTFFWILSPFLALGYITPYVEERYVTACLPFLFLVSILPLVSLEKYFKNKNLSIAQFCLVSVLLVLSISSVGFTSNYTWANQLVDAKKTSYLEVMEAGQWMKENSNTSALIVSQSIPQIQYYSERSTYAVDQLGNDSSSFHNKTLELKPTFLMLSVFENHQSWMYQFPQQYHLVPAKVLADDNNQPVVIIYKFPENYSQS